MYVYVYHVIPVEFRELFLGVSSLLPPCGSWAQVQVTKLGIRYLHPQSPSILLLKET